VAAVEFLEPAHVPRPEEPTPDGPVVGRPGFGLPVTASALMWGAAGVVALVAAFQKIYTLSYGSGAGRFSESIDGWGRISVSGPLTVDGSQYGARYGVVFCACAIVFVLLAVGSASALVVAPWRRVLPVALLVGVAAAAILAGLLAAVVLHAQSTLASARASVHRAAGLGDPIRGDLGTSYGPCIWLGLAALACAVAALGLNVLARPSAPATLEPVPEPALLPLLAADEELSDKRT
jgi:hypothetical protein